MKRRERGLATHTTLIDAAARVVHRDGVRGFTLDAVAHEAGVTKGGLLYHFESKQALVESMLTDALTRFEQRVLELAQPGPGGFVRAFVYATMEAAESPHAGRTAAALRVVMADAPDLLASYTRRSVEWQARLEQDGVPPVSATVARLAADGLFFATIFGSGGAFAHQHDALTAALDLLVQPQVPNLS
ncbi:TetR/AcrR family transcriptional regulator [Deinococcus pimensis]|uniref:TetR/AcrR family transcriptional regulator n=1 Tax=Deinococcus pimensis TaxID=309888 RepID=UPI0004AC75DC|nr:TetR/AcrR family transcriptional regulator [Deinococcus pimensis]